MKPEVELTDTLLLTDFPSGSSVNYYNGKLYLIGDDANDLLILDNKYRQLQSIRLFDHPEKRIPKSKKTDFETSTVIQYKGVASLLVLGSASRDERKKAMLLPLTDTIADSTVLFQPFFYEETFLVKLKDRGIEEVNIEGSTVVGNHLLLSNRGNLLKPWNHLIVTSNVELQVEKPFSVVKIELPEHTGEFIGVSELCYIESKNILLFALSSEATGNAYDDGVIGDSYIGCIYNFTDKLHDPVISLDKMINLSLVDKRFEKEKIEGICVESVTGDELTIHLVSDNDGGESRLFRIKVNIV